MLHTYVGENMETLFLLAALAGEPQMTPIPEKNPQVAVTCFKTGERSSGMNKICYYDCLGSAAAITISAVELCPLSIDN